MSMSNQRYAADDAAAALAIAQSVPTAIEVLRQREATTEQRGVAAQEQVAASHREVERQALELHRVNPARSGQ